ncbi:MAG: hypothetical protein WC358_08065 [Ignavibacteria bacterium]
MRDIFIWLYFIGCGLFLFLGLISCGIIDISALTQRLRGGRYELWYVDFPVCDTVWHYTTTPNKPPNCICRGRAIKIREFEGVWPFRRK